MSFFESASLVFISDFAAASASAVSGSGTNTGKAYNIKPIEELGSELVTNGGFDTDSSWNKNTGWTISNGTANCDGTQTGNSSIVQQNGVLGVSLSIENGKTYKVTLTTSNIVAGAITYIEVGGAYSNDDISTNGTHSVYVTAASTNNRITIAANLSFIGSVDNVSVKELTTPLADFDFERGSDITATRVNSSGLIEKGRGNFLLNSNLFDNGGIPPTAWTKINASLTSGQSGYDGTNNAWLLENSTGNLNAYVKQDKVFNNVQTASVYAKKGNVDYIYLRLGGSSSRGIYVNLSNGTLSSQFGDIIDYKITPIGSNGWYRISVTYDGNLSNFRIYPSAAGGTSTSLGDNIYIQDAQLEQGLVATDYIETTTEPLRAGILEDEPRFDYHNSASATPNTSPSLLLEPSRDNLIGHSEYFGGYSNANSTDEANATTSPEGLTNATSFLEAATTGQHKLTTSYGFDGSSTYTFSIFAKSNGRDLFIDTQNSNEWGGRAWFDLTNGTANAVLGTANIENFGNGWYRCIVTGASTLAGGNFIELLTSDGSNNSTTGDITKGVYIYGAQLEEGSYPTSYIPTYGTAATRGADFFDSNADFTNFFETNQGTIYIETAERLFENETNNETFIGFREDSSGNYWRIIGRDQQVFVQCIGWASSITYIYGGTNPTKYLFKWDGTNVSFYIDGALIGTAAQTATFSPNAFGRTGAGVSMSSQELLKQFVLLPTAISDTDCEILTGATTYSSFTAMASALNYTVYE